MATDTSSCSADATSDSSFLLAVKTPVAVPPGLSLLAARNPCEDLPVDSFKSASDMPGSSSQDASNTSQSPPNFRNEEGKSHEATSRSITEGPTAALDADDTLQAASLQSLPPAAEAGGCISVQVQFGMACHPNERFQTSCDANAEALTQLIEELRSHPKLDPNGMIKCLDMDGQQWLCVNDGLDLLQHITDGKLELRCHHHMDASHRLVEMKQLTLELRDALDLGQASPKALIDATLQNVLGGGQHVPLGLSMLEQLEWARHLVLG